MTMSSSDWGPRAKASHPLGTVDQRAMAMALAPPANDLLSSARVQSRAGRARWRAASRLDWIE